jgi:cation:H+ antiporter
MLLESAGILFGLLLLVIGADRFVIGAANIARILGMPPLIIGLTVVGIVTSAPEILVGSVAALEGKTEIAIGNAIGSNIANIGMVLGISVLIIPMVITSRTLRREFRLMLLSVIIALLLLIDQELSRMDSMVLLLILIGFMYWIIKIARQTARNDPLIREYKQELSATTPLSQSIIFLLVGLVVLLGGAELLVRCSVVIAEHFGISDLVIGLTIIAVGTSLPELAASIMCVIKKEADIAVGNVIGSNMFNMLAVIGIPGLIHPSGFESGVLLRDFPVMLGLTLVMGWMVFLHGAGRFDRIEGSFLLICFVSYQYWLFTGVGPA